ncbi:MAG: autotransporter outer membrane beta-barrel domain-containing protein [Pseudomonadota bacterium]
MLDAPLTVAAFSSFDAGLGSAGIVVINGHVTDAGLVMLGDGTVGDRLTINGDVSGAGSIHVSAVTASDMRMDVTVLDATGATSAGAFTLGSANITLPDGSPLQVVGNLTDAWEFDGAANGLIVSALDAGGAVTNNPVAPLL